MTGPSATESVARRILLLRGHSVMPDADLAKQLGGCAL